MDTCNRDADKVFAYKCGHVNYLQTISDAVCPTADLQIELQIASGSATGFFDWRHPSELIFFIL